MPTQRRGTPVRTIRLSDEAYAELLARGGRRWLEPILADLAKNRLQALRQPGPPSGITIAEKIDPGPF